MKSLSTVSTRFSKDMTSHCSLCYRVSCRHVRFMVRFSSIVRVIRFDFLFENNINLLITLLKRHRDWSDPIISAPIYPMMFKVVIQQTKVIEKSRRQNLVHSNERSYVLVMKRQEKFKQPFNIILNWHLLASSPGELQWSCKTTSKYWGKSQFKIIVLNNCLNFSSQNFIHFLTGTQKIPRWHTLYVHAGVTEVYY